MKKSLLSKKSKPSLKIQELHTAVIIVLGVAVVVLAFIVAVLLAQAADHRKSIDSLYDITTGLPTSEQLKAAEK